MFTTQIVEVDTVLSEMIKFPMVYVTDVAIKHSAVGTISHTRARCNITLYIIMHAL